ncbi:general stress protein [uncultured Massilia sp.]|uniref:general stress protein n=1 Tax=uncultured Massilia sp. TaxID=169973 RepID=UPI0025FC6159|nr:general stress protein [uncultured Massilia sp.]
MQHTLVAVFDNRSDAQSAVDELLASGYARTDVNLSSADPTGQTNSVTGASENVEGVHEEGIGASIKHFFTSLFGSDTDEHAMRYSDAVTRGHHVVTLTTHSEPEVERAADIIERFGPVDIDERHDLSGPASTLGAATLGTGTMAGAMSANTAGMQQSTSMSAQSASMQSQSGALAGAGGLNQSTVDQRASTAPGALQNAQSASMQRDEDDLPYPAKQDLNDDVPRGTTYQETMGSSQATGLGSGALQGTASMQGSNDMSLGGTVQTGNAQRDTGMSGSGLSGSSLSGSSLSGSMQRDTGASLSRERVRVYSRPMESTAVDAGGLRTSALDDDDFRKDWDSNYSSLGGSYDDYAPAYRYGSEARSKYSGRDWDDVEANLRSDWDSRYGTAGEPSTWEKFKAAVRRGWDKITPDSDDDAYRSDWDRNYSSLGGAYDDYAPAYRYGSEARSKYAGRSWDDAESDLRSDWDSRYATSGEPSTWEKFKAAVRHGWDKITPDMDDDDYYRSHWTSTYGSSGDTYNAYQPAYRYGNEMRRDARYTGRNWNDVESDLRTDWDTRYASNGVSTWEKFKAAVRHGWDRMTA